MLRRKYAEVWRQNLERHMAKDIEYTLPRLHTCQDATPAPAAPGTQEKGSGDPTPEAAPGQAGVAEGEKAQSFEDQEYLCSQQARLLFNTKGRDRLTLCEQNS